MDPLRTSSPVSLTGWVVQIAATVKQKEATARARAKAEHDKFEAKQMLRKRMIDRVSTNMHTSPSLPEMRKDVVVVKAC